MGGARAASEFVVKDGDTQYLYPQALVKQSITDVEPPFSDVDIIAEFSSDADWYFKQDNGTINSTQYDFEFVAAHEFTHGLGFGSAFIEYRAVFGQFVQSGYVAPLPINATNGIYN